MKTRSIVMTLMICMAGAVMCFAADANVGTWNLNESKSKIPAGSAKNTKVVYMPMGDQMMVTVDGTDADGKPAHNEWTGKFDGKDYAVTGDSASDTRAYTRVNAHTLKMVVKKGGKVTATGSIVVSADGKSRTVSTSGTDAKGKKVSTVGVAAYRRPLLPPTDRKCLPDCTGFAASLCCQPVGGAGLQACVKRVVPLALASEVLRDNPSSRADQLLNPFCQPQVVLSSMPHLRG